MNWIILSSDPKLLRSHLESGEQYLRNEIPSVLSLFDYQDGYKEHVRLSRLFAAEWHFAAEPDNDWPWRDALLDLTSRTRPNSTQEKMTLLTTDSTTFCRKVLSYDAWAILKDPNILSVSLAVPPVEPLREAFYHGGKVQARVWERADGLPTVVNTIWRTTDLTGSLCRTEWSDLPSMVAAVTSDTGLDRRTRMACFCESTIS